MDFRNVTDLFADPDFDGEPVMVKAMSEDDEFDHPDEEAGDELPVVDGETGEEVTFESPEAIWDAVIDGGDIVAEPRRKYYVNGVNVGVLNERHQYTDAHGKLITENLKDYTRRCVRQEYASLHDFLTKWEQAEQKQALIQELEEQGIILANFKDDITREMDVFDLICHAAFDQLPLSRKERANNVKKRNVFTKYGEQARKILESLLDKYADEGIENIESMQVLKLQPINQFGLPVEIITQFGGKAQYLKAIQELEQEIYKVA